MYEVWLNRMQDFLMDENPSSYLYVFHTCFKWTTLMHKQCKPTNKQFLHHCYHQIATQEINDGYRNLTSV
jgi:hypothetical protein